eukprot:15145454-Ditylum_brightwellii.AAC.1
MDANPTEKGETFQEEVKGGEKDGTDEDEDVDKDVDENADEDVDEKEGTKGEKTEKIVMMKMSMVIKKED